MLDADDAMHLSATRILDCCLGDSNCWALSRLRFPKLESLVCGVSSSGSTSASNTLKSEVGQGVLGAGWLSVSPFVLEASCGNRVAGVKGEVAGATGEVGADIVDFC